MKNVRGMTEPGHIFEQWAKHLETKASGLVMASIVGGGLIGAALGGVPLLRLSNAVVPHHLGYATLLIGAAAGAYLGWSFGERRAVGLRLQAEVTRRQFQVEQSLIRRVMQLAPTHPVQQAPVQPAPVAAVPQPPVQPAPLAPPPPPVAAPPPPPPPPPPAPAPVPPPLVPAPAPVTPLLTTPAPTAPAVPPVVSPIPAPTPEPPPAAAYAPQQAM
jgi:hypothetical protein